MDIINNFCTDLFLVAVRPIWDHYSIKEDMEDYWRDEFNTKESAILAIENIHTSPYDYYGGPLRLLAIKYKNDRDVMAKILEKNGECLKYASSSIRKDKELCKIAYGENGYAFNYFSNSLKYDREFILELVRINAYSFEHFPKRMRDDKEICLYCVDYDSFTNFQHVSKRLKLDKDIALASIKNLPDEIRSMESKFINDKSFLKEAIELNAEVYRYLPEEMKNDEELRNLYLEKGGKI